MWEIHVLHEFAHGEKYFSFVQPSFDYIIPELKIADTTQNHYLDTNELVYRIPSTLRGHCARKGHATPHCVVEFQQTQHPQ